MYNEGVSRAPGAANTPTLLAQQRRIGSPWTYPHCTPVLRDLERPRCARAAASSTRRHANTSTTTTVRLGSWPLGAVRVATRTRRGMRQRRLNGGACDGTKPAVAYDWPFSATTAQGRLSVRVAETLTGSFWPSITSMGAAGWCVAPWACHRTVSTAGYRSRATPKAIACCATTAIWRSASMGFVRTRGSEGRPADFGWLDRSPFRGTTRYIRLAGQATTSQSKSGPRRSLLRATEIYAAHRRRYNCGPRGRASCLGPGRLSKPIVAGRAWVGQAPSSPLRTPVAPRQGARAPWADAGSRCAQWAFPGTAKARGLPRLKAR
jgi:hypothetical protein